MWLIDAKISVNINISDSIIYSEAKACWAFVTKLELREFHKKLSVI